LSNEEQHKIVNTDNINAYQAISNPSIHREELTRQVNQLLVKDIIEPSSSTYNSPTWIVPKKLDLLSNKKWCMVIDYRRLNGKTIRDA